MTTRLENLAAALQSALGDKLTSVTTALGEITIVVSPERLVEAATALRDAPELRFEQLTDLCGVDYGGYGGGAEEGAPAGGGRGSRSARFAVVYQLLSISRNRRVRMRVFCPDDEFPVIRSVIDIWPSANWFEREAFDLFGIMFAGHPDLRRILTDYGFIGHPFRKDFPISGNVEMRYDPDQQRVIYQPVTIEPRVITPRIVRVENYADAEVKKG